MHPHIFLPPKKITISVLLFVLMSVHGGAQSTVKISQLNTPQLWQRLEFGISNVPAAVNPFDPDCIRLDAIFKSPSGKTNIVPAFWYQDYDRSLLDGKEQDAPIGSGMWRLRFTPQEIGSYSLSLFIKTNDMVSGGAAAIEFSVPPRQLSERFGYVRIAPGRQYFQTSDNQPLPLIGENVCWAGTAGTFSFDTWFSKMQKAGENYARVWMSPWEFGIENTNNALTNYSLLPAWQLDQVFRIAEQHGIYLLLCLDYHGMFAIEPDFWGGNNYWPKNPYNAANGGPCITPNDFFTSKTAQSLYEKRLRYLIARYGYSQHLMAWELFNEIDNDYNFLNSTNVATWHAEVGGWLHTHDAFGHLVTTSLTDRSDRPEIWSLPQLDFAAYHSYNEPAPANRFAKISQSFLKRYGKPVMIGEFGTDVAGWGRTNDLHLRGWRQGLWGGALGGSVGSAMSWWWENIDLENDYGIYSSLGSILHCTGWGRGVWTNIVFQANAVPSANAIGLRGPHESLIYVVNSAGSFPTNAATQTLPLQHNQTITLTGCPAGKYFAEWYDPATASALGVSRAATSNAILTLSLPDYREDIIAVLYLDDKEHNSKPDRPPKSQ